MYLALEHSTIFSTCISIYCFLAKDAVSHFFMRMYVHECCFLFYHDIYEILINS